MIGIDFLLFEAILSYGMNNKFQYVFWFISFELIDNDYWLMIY